MGKSQRCGLVLPVPRIERAVREACIAKNVSSSVPVFVTAAVEAVVGKIVLAAAESVEENKRRLTVPDILKAANADIDIGRLLSGYAHSTSVSALGERGSVLDFTLPADEQKVRQQKKRESAERRRVRLQEMATARKAAKQPAVAAA